MHPEYRRNVEVAVIEHGGCVQGDFEDKNGCRRHPRARDRGFRATMARLANHRRFLDVSSLLLGAKTSAEAKMAKMPAKAPTRMNISDSIQNISNHFVKKMQAAF